MAADHNNKAGRQRTAAAAPRRVKPAGVKAAVPRVSRPARDAGASIAVQPAEPLSTVQPRVEAAVRGQVSALGLDLVQLDIKANGSDWRLVAAIDRLPGRGAVSLDDCVHATHAIHAALEQDPISTCYELEVSSPGMQRLLRHAADMRRFAGMTARLVVQLPGQARETVVGVLVEACDGAGGEVALRTAVPLAKKGAKVSAKKVAGQLRRLPIAALQSAHLAPTMDEWMALGQRLAAESKALGEIADDATVAS